MRPLFAALGAGLALVTAAYGAEPALRLVRSGTAHEALFGMASRDQTLIGVGAEGAIVSSRDGGASWKAVSPAPTPLALLAVAIAPDHALSVGQQGLVLLGSADGQWRKVSSGTDARLFGVAVNAAGRAVAVGSFGAVIKSDDGGQSWTALDIDWRPYTDGSAQPHLYDVAVDEAGVITIVGEFGLILRSRDDGAHWQLLHKGEASLFAIDLRNPEFGFAVGQSGVVLRSTDAGQSWSPVDSGSQALLLGVRSEGSRVAVTAMRDLLLSEDGGRSWRHLSNPDIATSWYQGAGTDSRGGIWIVGHAGQIVRVGS